MNDYNLGEKQKLFADIIWQNEPIESRMLCEICEKELSWKRTTTYTMLKTLCTKGIFLNEDGVVRSVLSKQEVGVKQGEVILKESFRGSLPNFIAAFQASKQLKKEDIEYLKQLIEDYEEE